MFWTCDCRDTLGYVHSARVTKFHVASLDVIFTSMVLKRERDYAIRMLFFTVDVRFLNGARNYDFVKI